MDSMKEALMKRRGKGMELTVLLDGKPVMQGTAEMEKNTDLAPPPEGMDEGKGMEAPAPDMQDPQDQEEAQESPAMKDDELMTEGMSEQDALDMRDREKPRSLGERAKMAAFGRMKK
jgi:hypothetical protein